MKLTFVLITFVCSLKLSAQDDSTVVNISNEMDQKKEATKVFYDQRLINANTVEVLRKGVMEFKVTHNFGDIAGGGGGIKNFFGLDNAADVKIAFQVAVGNKLNVVAGRAKGGGLVQQLWELGLKYQFLQQMEHDPSHPFSLTLYANTVISAMKTSAFPDQENTFGDFSDRLSQMIQLMVARKFGGISLQVSPTYVHTNFVVPGDDKSIFAIGGAIRLPISKRFVLIADYFHPFRSEESRNVLNSQGFPLYDVFGAGIEIITQGHIFHMNFTNATNIIENRFIPRTNTSWGKGQYRWGFSIARRFVLFRDKKK